MIDDKTLAECSEFSHLVLFKKPPFYIASQVLHIPTDNYKYDLWFHTRDNDAIKVSLWRYLQSHWSSEPQASFLITRADYVANIGFIDNELAKVPVNIKTNCLWLEQSRVKAIFEHFKQFEIGKKAAKTKTNQQIEMFAEA